ncbi:hypothetical protein ABID59_006246 [Bradyrhizobium sp. S3.3.6]|uniref:Uncharacterized protein n=1 Tax=Bradyrhizobium cytisi TaxID=515489 RepID=A0A5S4WSA6_9BRAD|nr:hypothetical protein FXB38_20040 [Bradyrhizobium cytisi]
MRTAWTPHAAQASPLKGEAAVSGSTGRAPVTIDQFPAVILDVAMQSSAARRKAAYIVTWRRCFAPT